MAQTRILKSKQGLEIQQRSSTSQSWRSQTSTRWCLSPNVIKRYYKETRWRNTTQKPLLYGGNKPHYYDNSCCIHISPSLLAFKKILQTATLLSTDILYSATLRLENLPGQWLIRCCYVLFWWLPDWLLFFYRAVSCLAEPVSDVFWM